MPKYLVVYDLPSGMAQLENVLIVEAQSLDDARTKAKTSEHSTDFSAFKAFRLDEIEQEIWKYYK